MKSGFIRAAAGGLLAVILIIPASTTAEPHFADAGDVMLVTLGKQIYAGFCASCHGRNLQGQPLWQLNDKFARNRAPAHDETGHTWQHSDEDLFQKTKFGSFPAQPAAAAPTMPSFAAILDDYQIVAALAFIKARWPLGLRAAQAMLNPGFAGMPPNVNKIEWRLPPNCNVLLRRQGNASLQ